MGSVAVLCGLPLSVMPLDFETYFPSAHMAQRQTRSISRTNKLSSKPSVWFHFSLCGNAKYRNTQKESSIETAKTRNLNGLSNIVTHLLSFVPGCSYMETWCLLASRAPGPCCCKSEQLQASRVVSAHLNEGEKFMQNENVIGFNILQ